MTTETLTVQQHAEADRYRALIRDLARFVLALHQTAAAGAVRLACTFDVAGVELLIGAGREWPDRVVAIVEGEERHTFFVRSDELGVVLPGEPEHFEDSRTAVEHVLAGLSSATNQEES